MNDLLAQGRDFLKILNRAKAESGANFEWYRYDSLTNLQHISTFLNDDVLRGAREQGVLDIGCADGELSFFFESLGCAVVAMDHRVPNHNGMRGVRRLKEALKSRVEIREADLDSQFPVPEKRFGLTLFLGTLYHVKNPFYILETLAKCSEYCVMSTRVARRFPNLGKISGEASLAYLLDSDELNEDNSNFWIFSNAGLKLLLKRTWWDIVEYRHAGDTSKSDVYSLDRDERVFGLLRSAYGLANVELVSGWHKVEGSGWRWTEREFSIRTGGKRRLRMEVFIPEESARLGPLRLSIGDRVVHSFDREGVHRLALTLAGDSVQFQLDRALAGDGSDPRERGIIVASIQLA